MAHDFDSLQFCKAKFFAKLSETPDWLAGYEVHRIRRMPDTKACGGQKRGGQRARYEAGAGYEAGARYEAVRGWVQEEISGATSCYRAIGPWGVSTDKIRPIYLRQKDRFFWANWAIDISSQHVGCVSSQSTKLTTQNNYFFMGHESKQGMGWCYCASDVVDRITMCCASTYRHNVDVKHREKRDQG